MRLFSILIAIFIIFSAQAECAYTVIANPGENSSQNIRLNWHTDINTEKTYCYYTESSDKKWDNTKMAKPKRKLCSVFDSMYSKTPEGENIYERVEFIRNTVELKRLKPNTKYMYRIGTTPCEGEIRYFKTAPENEEWTAGIISDFHAYTPLPKRVDSAMSMLHTIEQQNGKEFDLILHVGDIIAWGGSYSFWKDLYNESYFKNYLWAGVNGNHDNMDRTNKKNSNAFFKHTNNNLNNGYKGEKGVCYYFTYGDALFIMLNNESMRSDDGLAQAQEWVRNVIKKQKDSKFIIVMEHYQWFFGTDGKSSQYDRWKNLFDECGVDLAISANNHIYARTNALYNGIETDGNKGTIYLQTPSSDNERGQELKEWIYNKDIIKFRWSEGAKTTGAITMKAFKDKLELTLYDRNGTSIDSFTVKAKRK